MPPESFGKLGCCYTTFGMYTRNFNCLLKFVHYLLFLLIVGQFCLIFLTSDCNSAQHIT